MIRWGKWEGERWKERERGRAIDGKREREGGRGRVRGLGEGRKKGRRMQLDCMIMGGGEESHDTSGK